MDTFITEHKSRARLSCWNAYSATFMQKPEECLKRIIFRKTFYRLTSSSPSSTHPSHFCTMLGKFSACDTPLQYRLWPTAKLFHSKYTGERDAGERAKRTVLQPMQFPLRESVYKNRHLKIS